MRHLYVLSLITLSLVACGNKEVTETPSGNIIVTPLEPIPEVPPDVIDDIIENELETSDKHLKCPHKCFRDSTRIVCVKIKKEKSHVN